ncbi:MAG: hypothetical protein ACPGTU_19360, partial [Myxococcota bacterium]
LHSYSTGTLVDPLGTPYTETKVRRGGGWDSTTERQVQVSSRTDRNHYLPNYGTGIRLARTAD